MKYEKMFIGKHTSGHGQLLDGWQRLAIVEMQRNERLCSYRPLSGVGRIGEERIRKTDAVLTYGQVFSLSESNRISGS